MRKLNVVNFLLSIVVFRVGFMLFELTYKEDPLTRIVSIPFHLMMIPTMSIPGLIDAWPLAIFSPWVRVHFAFILGICYFMRDGLWDLHVFESLTLWILASVRI